MTSTAALNNHKLKVLYVLGRGRSGSTIFGNVVGEHEGFFSAGEVRYLWDPVVKDNGACACGQPVRSCEVWGDVLSRFGDVNLEQAAGWQREVVTERNLPRLLRYSPHASWPALEGFKSLMARVYEQLAVVTGASVIVDSSKRPSYASVVRLIEECELFCIQMVRDPRASAHSWASRSHASVFGGGQEVRKRNAFDSTVRWDILNLEAEMLSRRLPPERRMRLRYEDFASRPRDVTADVVRFVGGNTIESPFVDGHTLRVAQSHAIAGNPSRFSTGDIRISDKAEWRVKQRRADRLVATAVALPYLRRYGYPLRSGSQTGD